MRIDEIREERYISQCPNETAVKLRKADRISLRANGAAGRGFSPAVPSSHKREANGHPDSLHTGLLSEEAIREARSQVAYD